MDRRSEDVDPQVLIRVARAYHLEDRSKVQIAADEGLSRFQVARLLQHARESGVVQVRVDDPAATDADLSRRLAIALGIRRSVVVGRSRALGMMPTIDSVAAALARLLSSTVMSGQRVGLTWSRVIERLPGHLLELPPCDVVQLAGALSFSGDRLGSVEVTRQVALLAGGVAHPFYAPLYVDDVRTAASLRRQPEIARCLDLIGQLDIAVVSVGHWSEQGSAVYPLLPRDRAEQLAAAGGICEVSGRLLDRAGEPLSADLDAHVIGIESDQLRAVPERIATSYGEYRAEATIAATRAGFVSTLVVDEPQARRVLELLDRG